MPQSSRHGYNLLADFMSWEPRFAIFRRFRCVNLLNLLYLQADLCALEDEIFDYIEFDESLNPVDGLNRSFDLKALKALPKDHPRAKSLRKLSNKLAQYSQSNDIDHNELVLLT